MAKNLQRPQLIECNPDNIPESMRRAKRWAPWAAPWDEEKQKYGKVPHRADRPEYGLSNGSASGWVTFEQALAAWRARPDLFAGVGYLMTGKHGVVGVDLDNCVKDGVVAPWAAEIAAKLDSYTEISPSGTGLHIMLEGDLESDWSAKLGPGPHTSKSPGVDVYGGGARFLTVTGAHLAGSPKSLRPAPAALDALAARYRKSKKADLHVLPLPTTYGMELPDLAELGLPPSVRNFLTEGPDPGADRSNLLIGAGAALAKAGLTPEQAFALMSENEHAMEVALSKRQYDDTKAREYLWTHHCRRGAAIVEEDRRLTLDSFEDYPGEDRREGAAKVETPLAEGGCSLDDFDVLEEPELTDEELVAGPVVSRDLAPVKREKFAPVQAGAFVARTTSASWLIKGALPAAGLGVIYGDSGAGKTFYVLDQVAAVCRGVDWRGIKTKKGRAVYICAEGAAGFQRRLAAYAQFHGVDLDDLDMGVITDVPSFMDKADIKALGLQLKKYGKIDLLVVDTYARVMVGGNENDAKDAGLVIAHCELLHRLTGAMVLLVHHSGKDASRGARGSGALRAAADLEVEVIALRGQRVATVTKMKDGEDGKEYAFRLHEVVLGQDEDGDDITSCVVEARDASMPISQHMKHATPTQLLVMRVLDTATGMAGAIHFSELKRLAVEQLPCDPDKKKDNRHRDVSKAIETLVSVGELVQAEGGTIQRANNSK